MEQLEFYQIQKRKNVELKSGRKILFDDWGAFQYSVEGLENLDKNKSYVFAGNHASAFDILLAYATLPFWIVSIAKIELRSIFFLGFVMKSAGHIFIDRNNHEKAIKSLNEAKRSLLQKSKIYFTLS